MTAELALLVGIALTQVADASPATEIDPRPALRAWVASGDADRVWKGLSVLVALERAAGRLGPLNDFLREQDAVAERAHLGAQVQIWLAENERVLGRHELAARAYAGLAERAPSD
ncbi:MAG TPA: hypothetical protein VFL83_17720, partial [Anaeromyxobacter sp.]|nr:hypothetical protein [Anaeromyxobacter sp.]